MVKVVQPLFGIEAHGTIGRVMSFRRGQTGPQVIAPGQAPRTPPIAGAKVRKCFAEAKAAHSAIPPTAFTVGNTTIWRRVPSWPVFWREWLIDHPECRA